MPSWLHRLLFCLVGLLLTNSPASAQFPLSAGPWQNLTTVLSPIDPAVTLSYRQPDPGACATAFSRQRQYTGWVSVPAADDGPDDTPTSLFFWFVSARQNTSALTVWLNGGPGSSSLFGFFTGNGPCEVYESGLGQYETVARQWGWDRASNMLFVDQPSQVGFSYDVLTNGSLDLLSGNTTYPPSPLPSGRPVGSVLNGTFGSGSPGSVANTTEGASMAMWHLMQAFLGTFPEFNAGPNSSVGVNLFAESYGGKYVPVFSELWQVQNNRRAAGLLPPQAVEIRLVSVGIINGCIDSLVETPLYPIMASNNTYNVAAISPLRATLANASFYSPGGCRDMILSCRNAVANPTAFPSSSFSPTASATSSASSAPSTSCSTSSFTVSVNSKSSSISLSPSPLPFASSAQAAAAATKLPDTTDSSVADAICSAASDICSSNVMEPFFASGLSAYDIAHTFPDPFPPSTFLEYTNTAAFQRAIGASLNFTSNSQLVSSSFSATGDIIRGPIIPKLAGLLAGGVRVGFIYGDRDYMCNWLGGEAVSLALAAAAGPVYEPAFSAAGYAPIVVNESYIGGLVRQYGNLSFSRVFQAGHYVASYQPETAFNIFARIVLGTSISTGSAVNLTSYASTGPASAQGPDALVAAAASELAPPAPAPTCWLRNFADTCDAAQQSMAIAGHGVTINGVLYASAADWPLASSMPNVLSASISSVTLTGIFTATATPSTVSNRASRPLDILLAKLGRDGGLRTLGLIVIVLVLWPT